MKVSVITVCYNSAKTIQKTLASVLAQNYDDYEYIIIDGASTDGTLDIIKEYEPGFSGKMRYVSEPDSGIYDAMNKGIRLAEGDFIGIINSDDFLEADSLNEIGEMISKYPKADIIYGSIKSLHHNGGIEISRRPHQDLPYDTMAHPGCFISKAAYEKYGYYSNEYKIAADYELLLRMYLHGALFQAVDCIVANFTFDGLSSRHWLRAELEKAAVSYEYKQFTPKQYFCVKLKLLGKYCFSKLIGN